MNSNDFAEGKKALGDAAEYFMKELGDKVGDGGVGSAVDKAIEYTRTERPAYVGEVGKRDGNYIFHFWPRTTEILGVFADKLGDAMLATFKFPERVSSKHDEVWKCSQGEKGDTTVSTEPLCRFWGGPEDFPGNTCPNCGSQNVGISMSSWAVKVTGYADNPLADELAGSVFDKLDALLSVP